MNPGKFVVAAFAAVLAGCTAYHSPGSAGEGAYVEVCRATSEQEIAALFDRWNASLQTGMPHRVVENYAGESILLPTLSDKPRLTPEEKEDYFRHFLEDRPAGRIDLRRIEIGCNRAVDAGLYTFTFARTGAVAHARYTFTYRWDGAQWLIGGHHSSAMPQGK